MINFFKQLLVECRLRIIIKPKLKRLYGRSKFYTIQQVQSVLAKTNLTEKIEQQAIACFCYEDEYNKEYGLKKKKSNYRLLRLIYGFNAKKRKKTKSCYDEDKVDISDNSF
jgi:hypothetical protein